MKSVLLVEDDEPFRALVKKILSPHFVVHCAGNGLAALRHLRPDQLPDLVVTDINLPDMNGVDLLQHIKRSGILRDLPVVILSGETQSNIVEKCMRHGASKFIPKPFDPKKFVSELNEVITGKVYSIPPEQNLSICTPHN